MSPCIGPYGAYSEQKNWLTKGQILLVGQIMAQGTKVKSWEIQVTKLGILSFVVPNEKYLALFVDLILTLEQGPLSQSVFLLTQFWPKSHDITWPNLKYHVTRSPWYIYYPWASSTPPVNLSSSTQQLITSLLQNGKSCHQVAAQLHVSHYMVQKIYSSVKDALPKHPGGRPRSLTATGHRLLAWKATSGAADNAPQLKRLLHLNVTPQTVRNALRRAGLKSAVKQKSLFFQRPIGGGSWSLPWSTSTGPWRTGAGLFGQMRLRLIGWGQMGGPGYGKSLALACKTSMSVGQSSLGVDPWWFGAAWPLKEWGICAG